MAIQFFEVTRKFPLAEAVACTPGVFLTELGVAAFLGQETGASRQGLHSSRALKDGYHFDMREGDDGWEGIILGLLPGSPGQCRSSLP